LGDIFLKLRISSINNPTKYKEVPFLVDTGATRSWVPEQIAEELGIESVGAVEVEIPDGSARRLPYGFCIFDFGGEKVVGNVFIGRQGTEPLVGSHVLEDFRIVIDMETLTISRKWALRSK
jgi:clan AA aspartic protease